MGKHWPLAMLRDAELLAISHCSDKVYQLQDVSFLTRQLVGPHGIMSRDSNIPLHDHRCHRPADTMLISRLCTEQICPVLADITNPIISPGSNKFILSWVSNCCLGRIYKRLSKNRSMSADGLMK
jgi:hypothetical protein